MNKKLAIGLLTVLSLGLLTACGGGDSGGGNADETKEISLGKGFKFEPATLTLVEGKTYNLVLKNIDTQPHTFVMKDLNVRTKKPVAAGKSETVQVKATKSGTFAFICDVAGHEAGGMKGEATISK